MEPWREGRTDARVLRSCRARGRRGLCHGRGRSASDEARNTAYARRGERRHPPRLWRQHRPFGSGWRRGYVVMARAGPYYPAERERRLPAGLVQPEQPSCPGSWRRRVEMPGCKAPLCPVLPASAFRVKCRRAYVPLHGQGHIINGRMLPWCAVPVAIVERFAPSGPELSGLPDSWRRVYPVWRWGSPSHKRFWGKGAGLGPAKLKLWSEARHKIEIGATAVDHASAPITFRSLEQIRIATPSASDERPEALEAPASTKETSRGRRCRALSRAAETVHSLAGEPTSYPAVGGGHSRKALPRAIHRRPRHDLGPRPIVLDVSCGKCHGGRLSAKQEMRMREMPILARVACRDATEGSPLASPIPALVGLQASWTSWTRPGPV